MGPPHSYVRMPFGLPSAVAAHQRLLRSILEAQEVRHRAVLAEVAMIPEDLHVPPEPWAWGLMRADVFTAHRSLPQHHFFFNSTR